MYENKGDRRKCEGHRKYCEHWKLNCSCATGNCKGERITLKSYWVEAWKCTRGRYQKRGTRMKEYYRGNNVDKRRNNAYRTMNLEHGRMNYECMRQKNWHVKKIVPTVLVSQWIIPITQEMRQGDHWDRIMLMREKIMHIHKLTTLGNNEQRAVKLSPFLCEGCY